LSVVAYGQRWQIETVNLIIKRRLAAHVAARTYWSQSRELMLLIITHNTMILLWVCWFSTEHSRPLFLPETTTRLVCSMPISLTKMCSLGYRILCLLAMITGNLHLAGGFAMLRITIVLGLLALCPLGYIGPAEPPARTDLYGDPLPEGAIARLGTLRLCQGGRQPAIMAYSPDGRWLAACSFDQNSPIRIWDTATGKELRTLPGHKRVIGALRFSPDGRLLASASAIESEVIIWDAATGQELKRLAVSWEGITALAFAPDSQTLAVAGRGKTIELWDASHWQQIRVLSAHDSATHALRFTADGRTLVACCHNRAIYSWDAMTGKVTRRVPTAISERSSDVVLAPNCEFVAEVEWPEVNAPAVVRLFSLEDGKEVGRLQRDGYSYWRCTFTPDSRRLVCAGMSSKGRLLVLLDTASGGELRCWNWVENPGGLACAPDGKTLALSDFGTLRFHDLDTGRPTLAVPTHPASVTDLEFASDGKTLIAGSVPGDISTWDAVTGKQKVAIQLTPRTSAGQRWPRLAINGHRRIAAAADFTEKSIRVMNLDTQTECCRIDEKVGAVSLLFTADATALAAVDAGHTVRVWSTATGKLLHSFGIPVNETGLCALSPDGTLMANSYAFDPEQQGGLPECHVSLWDIPSGKRTRQLGWRGGMPSSVTFSPDGKLLVIGHFLGFIPPEKFPEGKWPEELLHVWSLASGKKIAQWIGPRIRVHAIAFSPDGKMLAATDGDSISVLEVKSGKMRAQFRGHRNDIGAVAFAPNSEELVSGSRDRTALVWDLTGRTGSPPAGSVSDAKLQQAWRALIEGDAATAYRAMWTLTTAPQRVLPLLRQILKPVPVIPAERLNQLMADLDSDSFHVRKKAGKELDALGGAVDGFLRRQLKARPTLEARRRLEALLEKFESQPLAGMSLAECRALELLEHANNTEAQPLLRELAAGFPDAILTQEAQAALERLARR
jgi:WD40 repeat protein